MLGRIFGFAVSNSRKSTTSNRRPRHRSLRGVELLERREMMAVVPAFASMASIAISKTHGERPTSPDRTLNSGTALSSGATSAPGLAAIDEAFAQFDK